MNRYLEIDVIKGIAVLLMIIFHIFYIANHMGFNKFDSSKGIISLTASLAHYSFIIFSGINLFISYNKTEDKSKYRKKQIIRSFKLLIFAMIMTFLTYVTFGKNKYVKFGILHFMAVASILSLFTIQSKNLNLILLFGLVIFGIYVNNNTSKFDNICSKNPFICFIAGIYTYHTGKYGSMDHFDLLSKYPIFLIGIYLGHLFYKNKKIIKNKSLENNIIIKGLSWLGQNSLKVYFLHWFIIYGFLYIIGGRPIQ